MSDTVNTSSLQQTENAEEEVLDKLAYTKKRYLTPKEIAAFVLVNFGQKNLSQFIGGEKQFFLIQYAGLSDKHYANIELFATIYDAIDDTLSGLIIDRTRTRWGRVRPFFILPLPLWILGGMMLFSTPGITGVAQAVYVAIATIIYGLGMSYFGAWNLMTYNITPNINNIIVPISTELKIDIDNIVNDLTIFKNEYKSSELCLESDFCWNKIHIAQNITSIF